MGWLGGSGRAGWEKAPPVVEQEIRAVWQEDEMPDEIRQSPGYQPFTLSTDSQTWVDSMSEVVDGGNAVYGNPRPVAPPSHRSLASAPPAPAPPPSMGRSPSDYYPRTPTGWQLPPAPQTNRDLMPDIDSAPRRVDPPKPVARPRILMPDIEETSTAGREQGFGAGARQPSDARSAMPEIGDSTVVTGQARTLPRRVLVPEIGGDIQSVQPSQPVSRRPSMPDIGDDSEDDSSPRRRTNMPEIG